MVEMNLGRQSLLRWCIWFFLGHVLLFWLIGLIYLPSIPQLGMDHAIDVFVLFSYLGHLALLAVSPCLILVPIILLSSWRRVIFILSIAIATLTSSFLLLDTIVYNLYQYHLNGVVLTLAYHGITQDIFGLSVFEKFFPIIIFTVFMMVEWFYARWLWRRLSVRPFLRGWFKWIALFLGLSLSASYLMIFFSISQATVRVFVEEVRFLPLYIQMLSVLLPQKQRNFALINMDKNNPMGWETANPSLNYPMHVLQYAFKKHPMNLVIIAIDSWRFDMLNEEVTPSILTFSKKAWVFNNHFSGGNSTGPGIFTLFYGLPATYTRAMEQQHRGPILLDELIKQQYQLGIFSSAPLYTPPINRSVFQAIENLQIEMQSGSTVYERDKVVTKKFEEFIDNVDTKKPFFSFLFFDAAHSYCGTDENVGPFQPTAKSCNRLTFNKKRDYELYLNRYKNALLGIDLQVKQAIDILQAHKLLDNTVVMVVGDHGEEFDDSDRGYLGHASHFTRYQVQTPLIIYWPHKKPHHYTHNTSHFDVVPTLMTRLLGCKNTPADYSIGTSLLDKKLRPYFIITSYVNFGVMEGERITTIFPSGNYQIEQLNGASMLTANLNVTTMQQAFYDLRRFYNV